MRYVIALFDAPIPATSALSALAERGFGAADVTVVPPLPGTGWAASDADVTVVPPLPGTGWAASDAPMPAAAHAAELTRALRDLGVPDDDAPTYAEGIRRGAILIAVRAPTLSAPEAVAAIDGAAPPSLATHRARWAANPDLRYDWSAVPAPLVDTPRTPDHAPPAADGTDETKTPPDDRHDPSS